MVERSEKPAIAYYNNWMPSPLFEEYLRDWDSKLDHKIALIVDNYPVHPGGSTFKNIELIFLTATTTSLIQPPDQGIASHSRLGTDPK